MFKRFGIAVGAVAAGGAALAISEGDRVADAQRPLFTENIPGPPEGTGPIIVFLPRLGATTRYWKSRVAPLATRTRLQLVDLLGFGRSPKPWTTYTVEQHVAALRAVIEPIAARRSSTSPLWEMIYGYDLAEDLARMEDRIPLLCLHGDRDESAPPGPMRELARTHRDCTLVVSPGATHALPLEQPDWVRTQIASVTPTAAVRPRISASVKRTVDER